MGPKAACRVLPVATVYGIPAVLMRTRVSPVNAVNSDLAFSRVPSISKTTRVI